MHVPRSYRLYTEPERLTILATAMAEGLSASDVHRRFGVKPVTYYSWRKRCGLKLATGRPPRTEVPDSKSENTLSQESGRLAIGGPGAS